MIDVKKLREEQQAVYAEANAFSEKYSADVEPSSDEQKAQDERFAKLEKMQRSLDDAAKLAKFAYSGDRGDLAADVQRPTVKMPGKSSEQVAVENHNKGESMSYSREGFSRAMGEWVATGRMDESYAAITTATASGAFYPKQVGSPIVTSQGSALREAMAAVGVSAMQTPSTAEINLPVIAIGAGSDIGESNTAATDALAGGEPARINLKPVAIQSGAVDFSNLELAALDYAFDAEVEPALADAKEMRLEQKTFAAMKADTNITQAVTTATTTGFTYANLVDLNRKVSRRYDRLKVIVLGDDAYAAAEKMTGSDGQPILNRDAQNQQLLKFNGTPVVRSSYFDTLNGVSHVVGLLLSFVGVKVRDAGTTRIERYVNERVKIDNTGVNMIGYHCVGYVPDAIVKLITPAS